MQKNTPNYTPNTHFEVLECPGGASGGQNLQGGDGRAFPTPDEFFSKIPKNYIKNIHAKKYPKLYSQHPFWGTWMPWGGPGGSKSSEGLRRGFFAPNRKVQKPNIVCIYPINNSPVVKIENFEISILSPLPTRRYNLVLDESLHK